MAITTRPSNNYPGRLAVEHRLHEESNMTTIIELTEEDADDLAIRIEEWQDQRRRERNG